MSSSNGLLANPRILTAEYPTEHSNSVFSNACRVSNETLQRAPGRRTWMKTVLGKRDRMATGGLCRFRENSEDDAERWFPLAALSDGGLTAGDRDRVNVRRSYSLEGLSRLELLESDCPLPCRVMNVPFPLLSLL